MKRQEEDDVLALLMRVPFIALYVHAFVLHVLTFSLSMLLLLLAQMQHSQRLAMLTNGRVWLE